jgi:hypothetical protein
MTSFIFFTLKDKKIIVILISSAAYLHVSTHASDFKNLPQNVSFSKAKLSRYTPWWRLGGEDIQLLIILDLGTRWE